MLFFPDSMAPYTQEHGLKRLNAFCPLLCSLDRSFIGVRIQDLQTSLPFKNRERLICFGKPKNPMELSNQDDDEN
ncbi:hypothetical protein AYJ08_22010 [Brevibacillus sp. SKDU10]|nr:hypothetical protein AYJ08_22010 [Brevibacillus sp. SKDU10]